MLRPLLKVFILIVAVAAYVASPFVTAWQIREAVKSGDAAYLADKVEWDKVRETLKISLATAALDLPLEQSEADATGRAAAGKPTMWQRFKAYWGKGAVNRMVDNFANAEGLPKLFSYRRTYRDAVGEIDEPKTLANLPERMQEAWSRVRRAEFASPTRVEMEMTDKNDPDRRFAGILEFTGLEWKLVSLQVHQVKPRPTTGGLSTSFDGLLSRLKHAAIGPRMAAVTSGRNAVETPDAQSSPLER